MPLWSIWPQSYRYPQIAKLSCQAEREAVAQTPCGPGAVIGVVVAFILPCSILHSLLLSCLSLSQVLLQYTLVCLILSLSGDTCMIFNHIRFQFAIFHHAFSLAAVLFISGFLDVQVY